MVDVAKKVWVIAVAAVATSATLPTARAGDFNGGRTVPVHRFAPIDREGDTVSVRSRLPAAMSQERTCGQCHDVGKMKGGSHFRDGGTNDVVNKVNREPWFLCSTNGAVGTRAGCRVVSLQDRGGLTAWEWVKTFGYAFPGGGLASCPAAMEEAAGDRQRWFVTGPLEMNCLACHSQDDYDVSEWAKQTLRENWSGAALAAAGYARVEGMNARLEASWDPYIAENPDDHLFKVPEKIVYDPARFDDKGRCAFRVGKPRNENCLACHAVAEVGAPSHTIAGDVHLQRGMRCIDCHQNGMDHRIETKSCASCHIEKNGAGPKPTHVGFPLVHFEKLSCTVCHSGVGRTRQDASLPCEAPYQVRTMRANRIGIYGKAHWETDVPFIEEPFVRKNASGKVELCRRAALDPHPSPLTPHPSPLNSHPSTLNPQPSTHIYWPFAHDVRPARMARGADPDRCAACHSEKSGFFKDYEDPVYFSAFNLAFLGRPMFKVFLWGVFALLCLFGMAGAAVAVNRMTAVATSATLPANVWARFGHWVKVLVDVVFVGATLYLAASGVIGWWRGGMTWWWLMLHMVAGGVMAGAVMAIAVLRHGERVVAEADVTSTSLPVALWTLWLLFAAATVFTAVMPMMAVFGSEGQAFLLWSHRLTALAFAAVSVLVCAVARKRR